MTTIASRVQTQAKRAKPATLTKADKAKSSLKILSAVTSTPAPRAELHTAHRKKSSGYLTALMRLSYLAPQIIDDILDGRQPPELSAKRLLRTSSKLPLEWKSQRAHLRFI